MYLRKSLRIFQHWLFLCVWPHRWRKRQRAPTSLTGRSKSSFEAERGEQRRDKRPPKTKRKSARKFLRRHRRVWPINKTFAPEVINPGWLRNSKSIIFCLKRFSSYKAGLVVLLISFLLLRERIVFQILLL